MKKFLALVMILAMGICVLTACGGKKDALSGTWVEENNTDYGTVTWDFDGSGKCSLKNDYFSGDGEYTIKDDSTVNIKIDIWDAAKDYTYEISGDELKLTDPTGVAPNYTLKKK